MPVYRLKDYLNEEIKGTFYQAELQKVDVWKDEEFKVEKILQSRGRGQNKQYLLEWLHLPSKFISWVNANDVKAYVWLFMCIVPKFCNYVHKKNKRICNQRSDVIIYLLVSLLSWFIMREHTWHLNVQVHRDMFLPVIFKHVLTCSISVE